MRFYKNFVVFWALIYILIALTGRMFSYNKEFFPFFRWSLYSKTPNELVHPFVMVTKVGDEVLDNPTDITTMYEYHNIRKTDMNLNVHNFYNDIKNDVDLRIDFLKVLPKDSEFILYERRYNMSKVDYISTEKIFKIAEVKNNQLIVE